MLIVQVYVHVLPKRIEEFRRATLENASKSVREPGIARFDVLQSRDEPTRFLLTEVYRDAQAPARHKETEHYRRWRDTVEPMMAEARRSEKYDNVFPDEEGWG